MKLRRLFLKAFGPFTDAELDFSGAANLHLIYGPNEAGKSSALRAMIDLRYGIPARSRDDFVHDFKHMLVAACFENAAGEPVGLARRKGNRDTLALADTSTGQPLAAGTVPADVFLALTGGVERSQFETMYGLNSSRLRSGGQLLMEGDGELGAALFAASTGSASIKLMLETLQTDAKKYYTPRGQTPVLNEAARQLEEARVRFKQAVTKPEQWKTLHRSQEANSSNLADIRRRLAQMHRRVAELAELRAVEPLLRQLDQAAQQWAQTQAYIALPSDPPGKSDSAQQQQAQAQVTLDEVNAALLDGRQQLQCIQIEPQLLAHAAAITRLEADIGSIRRARDARSTLETSIGSEARQLMLHASQMTNGDPRIKVPDDLFRQLPSDADRAELERTLDAFQDKSRELQQGQTQLQGLRDKLAELEAEKFESPAPELQHALSQAMALAQALGDGDKRLGAMKLSLDAEQRKLDQSLADLALPSAQQLTASRSLPMAQIDAYERERSDLLEKLARDAEKTQDKENDLAEQQRRHKGLAATGELVTADTLKLARTVREQGWQEIRRVFVDPDTATPTAEEKDGLPKAFEHSQQDSDRQADLLREGAQRAAEVTECEQRIEQMTQALAVLQSSTDANNTALAALDDRWQQTLLGLNLPTGTAPAVREWQTTRKAALEQHERLVQAQQNHDQLQQQAVEASAALHAALLAIGRTPPGKTQSLNSLLALGVKVDRDLVAAKTADERRSADLRKVSKDIERHLALESKQVAKLAEYRGEISLQGRRLFLSGDAAPEAFKAQMAEMQRWRAEYERYQGHEAQLKQMNAALAAAQADAVSLSQLLQEPAGEHLEAWIDGLSQRLADSKEATTVKLGLERQVTDETRRRTQSLSALETAEKTLAHLMAQAGVQSADDLPDAEEQSQQKREINARHLDLERQLSSTSQKDATSLRADLENLDSVALDLEKQDCSSAVELLQAEEQTAIGAEHESRLALAAVDASDQAAQAREEMESAIARYRAGVRPWAQLKLAESLLAEALRRYREKAQGPVVELASEYFRLITGGRFARLMVDATGDTPMLLAQPTHGSSVEIAALSEGTADQLYLALRLAALQVQRKPDRMMPLVLDDVFITSDDERAANMFRALEKFSAQSQVLVFTHHQHLLDIATDVVAAASVHLHQLG